MKYIATFYSHFGAVRFKKECDKQGRAASLMPVPRDLSSSCGTCVAYEGESFEIDNLTIEELEQIVCDSPEGYKVLFKAKDS